VFDYVSWTSKAGGIREYQLVIDQAFVSAFGEASTLSIRADRDALTLSTGKMKPVMDALKKCDDDLFKRWGVDPAAQAVALQGSKPVSWFPNSSYPAEAKRRGATGRTVIVLTVSPQGRATACRAVVAADPALDATTCALGMRNARFEPTTASGDRYSVLSVRWEMWK
jgi:TonB family protein